MSELKLTLTEEHYRQLVNSFSKWEIENLVNLFDQQGKFHKYTYNNYQTLTFNVPDTKTEPVSPWRTDIENALRDGRDILIIDCHKFCYVVFPAIGLENNDWQNKKYYFKNGEITHWMPIPELPTI